MAKEMPGPSIGHWLDENQISFRQLLEALPVGAYTCDSQGLITYFNRRAVELWGREPKLNDPADRFAAPLNSSRPTVCPSSTITVGWRWRSRTSKDYPCQEIVIEREDGSRVTALAHASLLHNSSGQVIGAVNILIDISDRTEADTAQRLLAAIVESSDDAIIAKTLDGRILSWNGGAERLFGYTASEIIGSPITVIIPPERRDEERTILERLRRGERIDHFETVRVTKQGACSTFRSRFRRFATARAASWPPQRWPTISRSGSTRTRRWWCSRTS